LSNWEKVDGLLMIARRTSSWCNFAVCLDFRP